MNFCNSKIIILIVFITILIPIMLSAENQEKTVWTIRKNTPLLWDTYQAKGDADLKLKTIPRGSKVYPLAHKTLAYFKVELPSGEYGYVNYLDINNSYFITNKEPIKAYKREVYKSEFDVLPPNTKAYVMKVLNSGAYNVRIKDGRIRNVSRHKMDSPFFDSLPEVAQMYFQIYTIEKLQKMLVGKDISVAVKKLGSADALVYKTADKTVSEIYFSYVIAVKDQKRHKGIKLISRNNKIEKIEIIGGAKKSIAERLPLAGLIHSINLNNIFHGSNNYLIEEKNSNFKDFIFGRGWFNRIIGFIFLIIYFAIPQFISCLIRKLLVTLKSLSNEILIIIDSVILVFLAYLFFLILNLYVVLDQFIFTLIPMLISLIFFLKLNRKKIIRNRCPKCKTMWKASDKDLSDKEKAKSTKQKSKRTSSKKSGKKKRTKKAEKENKVCSNCGYDWNAKNEWL